MHGQRATATVQSTQGLRRGLPACAALMLCAASARAEAAAQAAPLPAPPQPAALYDRAGKIVTAPRAALVVALAAAAGAAAPAGAEQSGPSELERGKVIPEVTCLKAPGQTYALYLPPAYAPERKWPIVFGFAPDANGRRPVTLLKDAAEKYGYILAGSNRARNGPSPPIREATEAMWEDANARFSLDPRRGYATGFSGGARMAMVMALERPDRFAGIIPCGAFMPGGQGSVPEHVKQAVYGIVGSDDPNLAEFRQAARVFGQRIPTMWIEVFDGPHQWPSAALMSGAIDFMQAAAMRDKLIPADAAFLGAFVKGRLARAESYAEDNPLRAAQQFRQIARTFEGVEGAASASGRAETLENSPEVRRILARQAEIESRAAALSSTNEAAAAEALDWLKKAAEPKDAAGGEARRALLGASLRMQLRGVDALRNKRYEDAARWLERAFRAVPMDATAAYNAACAYSLLGRKADALKLLGEAVTAGFRDAGHIAADADLDPIRGEPGYRDIIKELGRDPGKDAGKD